MTKKIGTLVEDIYAVINDRGGWDATITEFFSQSMRDMVVARLENEEEERGSGLRMSNMGNPCKRALWYNVNSPNGGETLPPSTLLKFMYGDIIESLLLSLAMASGHDVRGMQDELEIEGIRGHRDCVIDGVTVDVKSASPFSFRKFKYGELASNDPFGYISQLGSYVYAGHRRDDTVHPTLGAFLVVDKVSGHVLLDFHSFDFRTVDKEAEFRETIEQINDLTTLPPRGFEPEDDGYYNRKTKTFVKNGNKVLGVNCSYCARKHECYPNLRTFLYKGQDGAKPKFFTHVNKEPKVMEVTNATSDDRDGS